MSYGWSVVDGSSRRLFSCTPFIIVFRWSYSLTYCTVDGSLGTVYAQSKFRLRHALAEIQNGIFSKSSFSLTKEKSCTLNLNCNFAEANFSLKIMRFPFLLKENLTRSGNSSYCTVTNMVKENKCLEKSSFTAKKISQLWRKIFFSIFLWSIFPNKRGKIPPKWRKKITQKGRKVFHKWRTLRLRKVP